MILDGERVRRGVARRQEARETRVGYAAIVARHPFWRDPGCREVVRREAVPEGRRFDGAQGIRQAVAHDFGVVVRVVGGSCEQHLRVLVEQRASRRVVPRILDQRENRRGRGRRQRRAAPNNPRGRPEAVGRRHDSGTVNGLIAGCPRADCHDIGLRSPEGARAAIRPQLHIAERGVCPGIRRADRVRLGARVARRCADRNDPAARGRGCDRPEAMSSVPAGDGEDGVRMKEGHQLDPAGREVPAIVEGPREAERGRGDLCFIARSGRAVVALPDEGEHIVEEPAGVDVPDGEELRLRREAEDRARLVLRDNRGGAERSVVPASRSECIADLKGDKIARTGSGYREAVPRPHHVGVGDRVRPVPDEIDKASGEVRHSIPVRVHPDFRRRDIRGLVISEVEVVI